MAKFIELTDIYDNLISFNVDNIIYIKNDKGNAFIALTGDTGETDNFFIVPDYDEVMRTIKIVSAQQ